jgi:hypothetical protein
MRRTETQKCVAGCRMTDHIRSEDIKELALTEINRIKGM